MIKTKFYIFTFLFIISFYFSYAQKSTEAAPTAAFSIKSTSFCEGDSIVFVNESKTASGTALSNVHWYFGDGYDTREENPTHKYASSGSFTVSLVAFTDASGSIEKDSISQSISINPVPSISFSLVGGGTNTNNDTSFLQGGTLTINVNENYPNYVWIPGGETTNSITVNQTGTYTVFVVDNNSCKNSKSQGVVVTQLTTGDSASIKIQNNILTLNGDGVNDYFVIKDLDKYEFPVELFIYNIWGDLIYHNSDYQNDWDGTYNGNLLNAGTYYYILTSKNRKGEMGYIDILR